MVGLRKQSVQPRLDENNTINPPVTARSSRLHVSVVFQNTEITVLCMCCCPFSGWTAPKLGSIFAAFISSEVCLHFVVFLFVFSGEGGEMPGRVERDETLFSFQQIMKNNLSLTFPHNELSSAS